MAGHEKISQFMSILKSRRNQFLFIMISKVHVRSSLHFYLVFVRLKFFTSFLLLVKMHFYIIVRIKFSIAPPIPKYIAANRIRKINLSDSLNTFYQKIGLEPLKCTFHGRGQLLHLTKRVFCLKSSKLFYVSRS